MLCCVNGLQREKATFIVRINICLIKNNVANDVYYVKDFFIRYYYLCFLLHFFYLCAQDSLLLQLKSVANFINFHQTFMVMEI